MSYCEGYENGIRRRREAYLRECTFLFNLSVLKDLLVRDIKYKQAFDMSEITSEQEQKKELQAQVELDKLQINKLSQSKTEVPSVF